MGLIKIELKEGDHVWYCQTVPPRVMEGHVVCIDSERGRLTYHISSALDGRIRMVHSNQVFTSEKAALAKLRMNVHNRLHWEKMTVATLENWLELHKEDS